MNSVYPVKPSSTYDSTSLTLFKKFGILNKNDLLTGSPSFSFNHNTLPLYFKIFVLLIPKCIIIMQEVREICIKRLIEQTTASTQPVIK